MFPTNTDVAQVMNDARLEYTGRRTGGEPPVRGLSIRRHRWARPAVTLRRWMTAS
jgi:hypothetical protein